MKKTLRTFRAYLPMIVYIIPISVVLYIYFGEPSEEIMDTINTISVYIIFTPVVLYLLVALFLVLNGDLVSEDKCKCCCKCYCCKGENNENTK